MAYVPPHKRVSNNNETAPPSPLGYGSSSSINYHAQSSSATKIVYAKKAISKWFLVGSHADLHLQPPLRSLDRNYGQKKPLILVHSQPQPQGEHARSPPWEALAAKVLQDLLYSFQNVRTEMEKQNVEFQQVKPVLVARFGKILFLGGPSAREKAMKENLADGTMLRRLHRTFYTNIPSSYMEKMKTELPLELGLELEYTEKDLYHVKLSDANRPEATLSCKCSVIKEQNKLQLHKIQMNQVRQMVMDVSCVDKNLDLRLMLCPKRNLTALEDDEMQCIQNLIDSAELDPDVKGGLRWPLGKASSGDRFSVVAVWHTVTKAYINPSLRLKVRHADRFDFKTSTGGSSSEVYLLLKGIVSELQVQKDDTALISKILEDTLKLIWDHFLNCDDFLG